MKKKLLDIFLIITIVLSIQTDLIFASTSKTLTEYEIWDGTVATSFAGGDGTENNPYLISNGAELALINNYLYSHFRLVSDIYLNDITNWENWSAENEPLNKWEPIGDFDNFFKGTFDGNGYSVYGLYMSGTENYTALFARTQNSLIKDFSIHKSFMFSSANMCGMLVGEAMTNAQIINCHNSGNVVTTGGHTAGLIGQVVGCKSIAYCSNSGKISNINNTYIDANDVLRIAGVVGSANETLIKDCVNTGTISSYGSQIGGVVGHAFGSSEISNCVNNGTITGLKPEKIASNWPAIGGVIGSIYDDVSVINCENNGQVSTEWENPTVGGVVGKINESGFVANCTNTADIIGGLTAGGIVGTGTSAIIEFCINKGNVTVISPENSEAAGIVGDQKCIVRNSVNKGKVSGAELCGGICGGINSYSGNVYNCINFGDISAGRYSGGICANTQKPMTVKNCLNIGKLSSENAKYIGYISGAPSKETIFHCYALSDSCDDAEDAKYTALITEEYLKSEDFKNILNNWVEENQRPSTAYSHWESDDEGYPVPLGDVPEYIPVMGTLTLHQPENGSASISHTSARTETKITVTLNPNTGFIPYQVWLCTEEEPEKTVYAQKTGTYEFSFPMPYGNADVYTSVLALPENFVWDGTVATAFAGGDGTENNPYLIGNAEQLALVENYKWNAKEFRLIADIYLNDTINWESWSAENKPDNIWAPLSCGDAVFDGNGYTIYGLYTDTNSNSQGLFNQISTDAIVKNLTIDKSRVMGRENVGAIAGQNYGKIFNCVNKAKVSAITRNAGGIAGCSSNLVSTCMNYGEIYAPEYCGGIIGQSGNMEIQNCINYANIDGSFRVGGITGGLISSRAINSVNYGAVTARKNENLAHSGEDAGGIAGEIVTTYSPIENCINRGKIKGLRRVGGICGYIRDAKLTKCSNEGYISSETGFAGGIVGTADTYIEDLSIELCSNMATIDGGTSEESNATGGLVGYAPVQNGNSFLIRNCHNAGSVHGNSCVAGLVAELRVLDKSCALVENCYSIGSISGTTTSGTIERVYLKTSDVRATVQNCYCLNNSPSSIKKSGYTDSLVISNVKSLTEEQLKNADNFTGFDFEKVWCYKQDGAYPILQSNDESIMLEIFVPTVEGWERGEDGLLVPSSRTIYVELEQYITLSGELEWNILNNEHIGASIDNYGRLNINSKCKSGTINILVSNGQQNQMLQLNMKRLKSYCKGGCINSQYKMEVPKEGVITQQCSVTIYDQYGDVIEPSLYKAHWFLVEENDWNTEYKNYKGITINDNGLITLPAGTPECQLIIRVRLDEWTNGSSCQNGLHIINNEMKELSGTMNEVLEYSGSYGQFVTVTLDENIDEEFVYVILASFEDGKMTGCDIAKLSAGESDTLDLDDWGESVKILAWSNEYAPLCGAQSL